MKARRRTFTAAYKLAILAELDKAKFGETGAVLRREGLRIDACMEDIDHQAPRGLDRNLTARLASCQWIRDGLNLLVTGPTGAGETWIACGLAIRRVARTYRCAMPGRRACWKTSSSPEPMAAIRGSQGPRQGQPAYPRRLGRRPMTAKPRRHLLEVNDDRAGRGATIITSQLPFTDWHDAVGDATLADAILGRLIHSAHRIDFVSEPMRRKAAADAMEA
ncbi:ATP-binding protein [Caenispirillum salinarum]|uniref:ATP-binding protein n=1 Tax=Caenispirillum salinarum TaxID=859058 RepID=UPI00384BCC5E